MLRFTFEPTTVDGKERFQWVLRVGAPGDDDAGQVAVDGVLAQGAPSGYTDKQAAIAAAVVVKDAIGRATIPEQAGAGRVGGVARIGRSPVVFRETAAATAAGRLARRTGTSTARRTTRAAPAQRPAHPSPAPGATETVAATNDVEAAPAAGTTTQQQHPTGKTAAPPGEKTRSAATSSEKKSTATSSEKK